MNRLKQTQKANYRSKMSLRIVIDTIRKERKTKNITTSGQSQKPIRKSYI